MKKLWLVLLIILGLHASSVHAQNIRWDFQASKVVGTGGNLLAIYAIPGVQVSFYVCSGDSPSSCSTLASTYNSPSSSSACPTGSQVVLQNSAACGSKADGGGNFGAWFKCSSAPCQYAYTFTGAGITSGPIMFTVGSATGGGGGSLLLQHNDVDLVDQVLLNFDDTIPAAPFGNVNGTFQSDSVGHLSVYVPAPCSALVDSSVNCSFNTVVPCTGCDLSTTFSVQTFGEGAVHRIGNNVADIVAIGDEPISAAFTGSYDIVAIGDAADHQCESPTFTGCSATSQPNPILQHDVVAIGDSAAIYNQGSDVTAIGDQALGTSQFFANLGFYNQGVNNVAIGSQVLVGNTTGIQNTAIGSYAGSDGYIGFPTNTMGNANHTGSNNTWIGFDSGPNTTTQLSNTIALGYQAHNNVSNQTTIGNASTTSLIIFGCPSGQTAFDDGSGTCYVPSGGGSAAFSSLLGGTNTSSTMICGTGCSMGVAGSGTIGATSVGGVTVTGTPSTGQVITATSSSTANWQTPSGGGGSAFSAITGGTNSSAAMVVNTGASINFSGSGTINASSISGVALSGLCQTGGAGCPSTTGTVTHTAGALTAQKCVIGNGAGDIKIDSSCSLDGSGNLVVNSVGTNGPNNGSFNPIWTGVAAAAPGLHQFQISPAIDVTSPWSLSPAAAPATGVLFGTNSAGIVQQSFIPLQGTDTKILTAGTVSGTSVLLCTDAIGGATTAGCPTIGTANLVASAEIVSFSATPTFSTSFNSSRIVLTGNITTFTLAAGTDGQNKNLCFKQGAGPFTVAAPANVHGFFTVGTTNAGWNCQAFSYDNTDSIWLATTTGVINQ